LAFRLRVPPSGSASTYSRSVLGARGNLEAPQGTFKAVRARKERKFRTLRYPHLHTPVEKPVGNGESTAS